MKATYTNDAPYIEVTATLKGRKIVKVVPDPIIDDEFEACDETGQWLPGIFTKSALVSGGADEGVL